MSSTHTTNPGFRAYPTEQAVAIIRAIAEHRWPMTINEAFTLRDQFGWKPAPDDGRYFVTPVSSGNEDGNIGLDFTNRNFVSEIGFNLSTHFPPDAPPEIQIAVQNAYASYVNALNSLYRAGDSESDQIVASTQWILPSRASVTIAATRGLVSATVESPAMTDLTEAEQRYFDEGGEL
ncbi:DUF6301 family protein [Actinomyces sp. ZJ308]|uniref:DUF6301 family protein n=1 Tax=Actinomyces sp. ZJ308 TaxID=2708342 RepID=UPI00142434CE|nr:DUF6301 family protein [Actinomyces sp. ZJ308]